jgi:RNA polymerase sigma-70 factor (ECF subfamily)
MSHTVEVGQESGKREGGGEGSSGHPLIGPLTESRFAEALVACLPALRVTARQLAPAAADTADLVQATVLRALEKRHRFVFLSDASFRGWLVAIMKNIHVDTARKVRREVLKPAFGELPDHSADDPTPAWRLIEDDLVDEAVRALPPKLQTPYVLFTVNGLSYSAIASRLRVPFPTIGTRIHRARKQLQVRIETGTAPNARRAA